MKNCKLIHEFKEERNKFGKFFQLYRDARHYISKFHDCYKKCIWYSVEETGVHLCRLGINYREMIFAEKTVLLSVELNVA